MIGATNDTYFVSSFYTIDVLFEKFLFAPVFRGSLIEGLLHFYELKRSSYSTPSGDNNFCFVSNVNKKIATADTKPTQRDGHIQAIARKGRRLLPPPCNVFLPADLHYAAASTGSGAIAAASSLSAHSGRKPLTSSSSAKCSSSQALRHASG
jgi:hypothetical protein